MTVVVALIALARTLHAAPRQVAFAAEQVMGTATDLANTYRYRMAVAFALALTGLPRVVSAQIWPPATFAPWSPTDQNQIHATFTIPGGCTNTSSTLVSGSVVRTDVFFVGCVVGPPTVLVPHLAVFGPVPAVFNFETGPPELRSQQPLVVTQAPPPVPALSGGTSAVLMAALAVVALSVLRRAAAG